MKKYEQTLKDVLQEMIDGSGKMKVKLHQTKINTVWPQLMGTTIANYTKEIKLYNNKLFLTINSAPLKQELSYSKHKIINMLNEELGEEYIKEVVLR